MQKAARLQPIRRHRPETVAHNGVERLRSATGLKVKLEGTQEKGKITLQYTSEEELQRLWEWMER